MESGELMFLVDPTVRAAAIRRALRLVRTRVDAEDAVQEATVRALRYRHALRPGLPGRPWFFQIVSRVFGGMILSTLLNLVVVPVLYTVVEA